MQLYEVIWKEQFVDKIECKHQVNPDEVEQVLFSQPHLRRAHDICFAHFGQRYECIGAQVL